MGLLDGKVVVVTGAGRGIGREEALLFGRHGAQVVVNDLGCMPDGRGSDESPARAVVAEIVEAGGQALADFNDVASAEGAAALAGATVARFGRVDVLVNNAGIVIDTPLLELSPEQWQQGLAAGLHGTFFCTQAMARQMVAQGGGGRIVNTTGITGLLGEPKSATGATAYGAAHALTRACAIQLQAHGIFVNALAPTASTRLTSERPDFEGRPELSAQHVAPAALFLASALAGDMSGRVLAVAGSRVYSYRLVASEGQVKDGDGVWEAELIAEHFEAIAR